MTTTGALDLADKTRNGRWVIIVAVVITALVVTAITVPMTYFLHPDYNREAPCATCPLGDSLRVSCYPGWDEATEAQCLARGCVYSEPTESLAAAKCFFPKSYGGYRMVGNEVQTVSGYKVTLERIPSTPTMFGGDIAKLMLDIEFHTEYRLRFKFYDPANARFEVPLEMPKAPTTQPAQMMYQVTFTKDPFSFKVTRKSTGTVLWDTSLGPLVFSDQFLQLTTILPSSNIYGFGESTHESFRHDIKWKSWGMFSRDQPPGSIANLYGVHPFYMSLEEDNKAHGVLLLNSNAMDIALQPTPALTYHTTGGILDFWMFLGPTPETVIQQYTEAIGRPYMPPYWALGFQLCRYGYNSLSRVKEVVAGMRQYDIPLDIQYGDIDYMERQLDFTIGDTYDGLGDFVDELKEQGTRYIIILDPAISANESTGTYLPYEEGVSSDIYIKGPDGKSIRFGKVWPDLPNIEVDTLKDWNYQVANYRAHAAFPDFRKSSTKTWWTKQIRDFYDKVKFDGIWIDMNEPASFVEGSTSGCSDNKYDTPPFRPRIYGNLADKTLCMDSVQHDTESTTTIHYNMHSLFGWSQTEPTLRANEAATGKRGIVISRSTYPGSGKYAGHWLGDNTSRWKDLHYSIIDPVNCLDSVKYMWCPCSIGMLEFSLFGIPYIGADICGFFENTTKPLCRRWMQLGSFYPFSRNHNGLGYMPQDPASFGEEFARDARDVLHIRYTLLPYLYTLFYEAHTKGSTVVRPLMHEFTADRNTWSIDRQFLWGPALLISPVLEENQVMVDAYFPKGPWYIYENGSQVSTYQEKTIVRLPTPMNKIQLHVRGGYILPTQQPANSTVFSRINPFGLIVALDDSQTAKGNLFWDDGESIDTITSGDYFHVDFLVANRVLQSTITLSNPTLMSGLVLDDIKIWGLNGPVTKITYQNSELSGSNWSYNEAFRILEINGLDHKMKDNFILEWFN